MKLRIVRWIAIFLLLETGALHLANAQSQYDKAPYLGYLFMLILLGALIAAFGVTYNQKWGWLIGAFTSLTSLALYFSARLVSLPDLPIQPWRYPFGVMTSPAAGLFILLCLLRPWTFSASAPASSPTFGWVRVLVPIATVTSIIVTTFATHQWDVYARQVGYHEHVGSLDFVCNTPVTTFAELQEKYGLRVILVANTAMDSIVDVRLMVVDAVKADKLLVNQAAILVDSQVLILAPHIHRHTKLIEGNPVLLFFSTGDDTVRSGSQVSLVFGKVRLEPVTVR